MDGEVKSEEIVREEKNEDNVKECTCHKHYESDFDIEEKNAKLEQKLKDLKELMGTLRVQLIEEKEAWQKEIYEATKLANNIVNSYNCEHEFSQKEDISVISETEPTLSEVSMLDFEHKLSTYQDALTKAHAERRKFLKRQIAANAYKKRLMEVEDMCNLELMKVRQNVQFLMPLQKIALEWQDDEIRKMASMDKLDEEITGKRDKISTDDESLKSLMEGQTKHEFLTLESLEHKIYSDFKDLASQLPLTNSICINDDDELRLSRIQSMSWYNNEMGHQIL